MTFGSHMLSLIGLVVLTGLFVGWPVFFLARPATGQPEPETSAFVVNALPGPLGLMRRAALPPTFEDNPLLQPAANAMINIPRPLFDWSDATGGVLSYTLFVSSAHRSQAFTATESAFSMPHDLPGSGVYSWTVQAHSDAGSSHPITPALTFTLQYTWYLFVPVISKMPSCPALSNQSYNTVPILGAAADRPGPQHADLNLALRGYSETNAPKVLVLYNGGTDPNAPQLAGLFEPNSFPNISAVFRVNHWVWANYPDPGHVGGPITDWPVTLMELPAALGTPLHIPERGPEIYPGGYKAMVLYAEEHRITLNFTRDDTVANGYTVHLENICVDPNLLALYRAQTDSSGWHVTNQLPALKNNQPLGSAFLGRVRVAIRDRGAFMDPRSGKDWWVGYPTTLEIQRSHDTSLK